MFEVKLHDLGEGMTQADITQFFVQPGDIVKADDPLLEVQTDKMTAEIPAPTAGIVVDINVDIGSTISVGTLLMVIESMDKQAHSKSEPTYKDFLEKIPLKEKKESITYIKPNRILASPFTRKIAREHGIRIEDIKGTGPANRIIDQDVFAFIENQSPSIKPNKLIDTTSDRLQSIPYKGIRKQIGKKMSHASLTL